jgi:predicted dithiol-disulfide oxidoreductase (DUF899 family)
MVTSTKNEIDRLRDEIRSRKEQLFALSQDLEPELAADYEFAGHHGERVHLSGLFGSHDDLIVIHNMGKGCSYCTMWADGFAGLYNHLQSRAAFVISSPDLPAVQDEFKRSRKWPFTMVSPGDSGFTKDMGFLGNEGYLPGVSAFHKNDDGSIIRTGHDRFGPYDEYNAAWNLFNLLEGGARGWEPQYRYP